MLLYCKHTPEQPFTALIIYPNKLFGAFYRRTISHAFGEKAGWRNDLNSLFLRAACLYTPDKHLKRS
jgi:hypothetical protein